jgi:hypothetical protein
MSRCWLFGREPGGRASEDQIVTLMVGPCCSLRRPVGLAINRGGHKASAIASRREVGFFAAMSCLRHCLGGLVECRGASGLDQCGQATKGAWGMSWRQKAWKGVEDCEKLGGAVKRVLIPRYPNWRALNP